MQRTRSIILKTNDNTWTIHDVLAGLDSPRRSRIDLLRKSRRLALPRQARWIPRRLLFGMQAAIISFLCLEIFSRIPFVSLKLLPFTISTAVIGAAWIALAGIIYLLFARALDLQAKPVLLSLLENDNIPVCRNCAYFLGGNEIESKQCSECGVLISKRSFEELYRYMVPPVVSGNTVVGTHGLLCYPRESLEQIEEVFIKGNGKYMLVFRALWFIGLGGLPFLAIITSDMPLFSVFYKTGYGWMFVIGYLIVFGLAHVVLLKMRDAEIANCAKLVKKGEKQG